MSDTQTNESNGILGELHAFEKKIEHALGLDGSPSSTEPTSGNDAGGVSSGQRSPVETSVQDVQGSNAGAEGNGTPGQALNATPSTGDQSGSEPEGEQGNVASGKGALPDSQQQASPSSSATDAGAAGGKGNGVNGATVSVSETATGDDAPNAAAPTVGDNSASDTQSSARAVSVLGGALETVASVSEQVNARIYKLRQHFWTFEANARAPFIKLLDEIEALVK